MSTNIKILVLAASGLAEDTARGGVRGGGYDRDGHPRQVKVDEEPGTVE